MESQSAVPYLLGVKIIPERLPPKPEHPFNLPFVKQLDLTIRKPMTFFVGENGTGKSTLIEAIAVLCGLPVSGGGKNDLTSRVGPEDDSPLSLALRPAFKRRPPDGYFFRAEFQAHFASLLDEREKDPDFWGDPYGRYGGKSLHQRSHGEAYFAVMKNRIAAGLYLMDEPEAALSPQRQLALLGLMHDLIQQGNVQFIVATHSPILMTYPGAKIVSFDGGKLSSISLEKTSHYQITRRILEQPSLYWKYLLEDH